MTVGCVCPQAAQALWRRQRWGEPRIQGAQKCCQAPRFRPPPHPCFRPLSSRHASPSTVCLPPSPPHPLLPSFCMLVPLPPVAAAVPSSPSQACKRQKHIACCLMCSLLDAYAGRTVQCSLMSAKSFTSSLTTGFLTCWCMHTGCAPGSRGAEAAAGCRAPERAAPPPPREPERERERERPLPPPARPDPRERDNRDRYKLCHTNSAHRSQQTLTHPQACSASSLLPFHDCRAGEHQPFSCRRRMTGRPGV